MVQRKVTYRLYPTPRQIEALERLRWVHCLLWNTALDERRRAWAYQQKSLSFSDQCKALTGWRSRSPLLRSVNAQSEQVTLKRLDLAFQHFFRRVKRGETPGYPRFKPLHRFKGWGYSKHGDGWKLLSGPGMKHGKLRLSGVGEVRIRGKARTVGTPKTCEILHRCGKWYASVTVECEPERQGGERIGGLDWGVETLATIASAEGVERIENPRHLQRSLERIGALQKRISRKEEAAKQASGKKKGFPVSKRLRKEYALLAGVHEKVANQRRDFLHKTSARLIATFAVLGLEALNIRRMTAKGGTYKRGLNRSILDAAGSMLHQMLRYKAEEAGALAIEADPRQLKPSQRCHRCGRQEKKPLSQRWHDCPCGVSCSRDENAARVLMGWVMERIGGREPAEAWREVDLSLPGEPALPWKRETPAIPLGWRE
ncbi:RNA-guided endonuclease TnpB family protein [Methylothermus subterraneus]